MKTPLGKYISRFYPFTLGAAAAVFALSPRIYTPIILLCSLLWLLNVKRNIASFRTPELKWTYATIIAMYVIQIIGLIYTTHWTEAMKELETKSSIVALSTLVLLSGLTLNGIRIVFWMFSISIITMTLYLITFAAHAAIAEGHGIVQFISGYQYQTTYFTAPLEIHPTYLSLLASLVIFFLATELLSNNSVWRKMILALLILFLIVINFVLLSRGALIALGLAGIVFLIFEFMIIRYNPWPVVGVIGIYTLLIIIAFSFIPNFKYRFLDQIKNVKEYAEGYYPNNSTSLHFHSWKCSVLLIQERPILGYGTGEEVEQLLKCYSENGLIDSFENRYNAHNEFLSTMLNHGLIGLLVLMVFLGYALKLAIRYRDSLLMSALILFLIVSLFESTLNVYRGVVFLSLFESLLARRCVLKAISTSQPRDSPCP